MIGISVGDAFKAIELLFKGFDVYVSADKRLFTDHIDPCFKKLEAIHQDYLNSFQALGAMARARIDYPRLFDLNAKSRNRQKLQDMIEFVLRERGSLRVARASIREVSEGWASTDSRRLPSEARAFFEAVCSYFYLMAQSSKLSNDIYSTGYSLVMANLNEALEEVATWDEFQVVAYLAQLSTYFQRAQDDLEERWRMIASAYAKAQISLVR